MCIRITFEMLVAKPSAKFSIVCVLALVTLFTVTYLTNHHLMVDLLRQV